MSPNFMTEQIERAWRLDPSKRTVLYYAFLLMENALRQKEKLGIKTNLKEMVSVESGDFDSIIHEFVFFGIMEDSDTCYLTDNAVQEIRTHIDNSMIASGYIPFNGLEIYQAKPDKRFQLWVEQGTELIKKIFADVPSIRFQTIEIGRKRGRLLIIQTGIHDPSLIIYFINTHRMKQMSELEPLRACSEEILFQRIRELQKDVEINKLESLNSLKAISIVAAPTYSTSTAAEAASSEIPTRLIGPINLAIIGKYFLNQRPYCREQQYISLLEYLDPINGGMRGGIIFSTWLEQHIERRVGECYKEKG